MADANVFLGMTKKRAQDRAEEMNLIFRLVRIDGKDFLGYPSPEDLRTDRLCVEIDNGAVTKATIQ